MTFLAEGAFDWRLVMRHLIAITVPVGIRAKHWLEPHQDCVCG